VVRYSVPLDAGPLLDQQVGVHLALPLHGHLPSVLEVEEPREAARRRLCDLHLPGDAGRVHSTGHVHGVAPDVVQELRGPDHACSHFAYIPLCSSRWLFEDVPKAPSHGTDQSLLLKPNQKSKTPLF